MSTIKKTTKPVAKPIIKKEHQFGFVFTKMNIYLMFAGIAFLILGYILMAGGKSNDPSVFNEQIFDTQRLTIAPTLLVIGFVIEIFAIMYRPKSKSPSDNL